VPLSSGPQRTGAADRPGRIRTGAPLNEPGPAAALHGACTGRPLPATTTER
jgi:hypothetical protein